MPTLALALLALGLSAGCDEAPAPGPDAVAGGDLASADGGPTDCDPDRQLDSCYRCEDTSCCSEVLACEGSAACRTLAACLADCPPETATDHVCADACYQDSPDGVALLGARLSCNVRRCSADCPGEDLPCVTCYAEACATEYTACSSQADCFLLVRCSQRCSDDACTQDCRKQYPAGAAGFEALLDCTFERCADPCQ